MAKEKKEGDLEVKTLFERIIATMALEDAGAKEVGLSLLKEETDLLELNHESLKEVLNSFQIDFEELEELRQLRDALKGKWVLDNDPSILNTHQVREQAVILVP